MKFTFFAGSLFRKNPYFSMFDLILKNMKSLKFLVAAVFVGVLLLYSGCKPKPGPGQSIEDGQLVKLSKTWKFTAATLDGLAQTGYTNFQLIISGTAGNKTFGYTASGRPSPLSPWPASGTFTFGTDASTQVTRDDGLPITYAVTDAQLQITFNYTGAGIAGRVTQVKGNWVLTFTP